MGKKKDRIIYSVSVADVQEVADQLLGRELTPEELKLVEDRVDDYISYTSWYDAIALAINEKIGDNSNSFIEDNEDE
jgi:hypothetical protein